MGGATARTAVLGAKSGIKKVNVRCVVCGADDYQIVADVREFEYTNTTTDTFHYVRCRQCGLHYLHPRPDVSELETIYPPEYHVYRPPEAAAKTTLQRIRALGDVVRKSIEKRRVRSGLLSLVRNKPDATILDIGCADGRQLLMMREANPSYRLFGVEIDRPSADAARGAGLDVQAARFEDVAFPPGTFDLVHCSNIIEHVEDPGAFLSKIHTLLVPGGYAVILTPWTGGLDHVLFGKRHWGGYHVPRHWNLWDDKNFSRFARDRGFDVARIDSVLVPTHWIWSLHHWTMERGWPDWFVRRIHMHNFFWLASFTLLELVLSKVFRTSEMRSVLRKRADAAVGQAA